MKLTTKPTTEPATESATEPAIRLPHGAAIGRASRAAAAVLGLLLVQPAAAHDYCPKAECEKVKQKIRKLESRMRQGYSRAQGERMAEELRELRARRSKRCR